MKTNIEWLQSCLVIGMLFSYKNEISNDRLKDSNSMKRSSTLPTFIHERSMFLLLYMELLSIDIEGRAKSSIHIFV